MSPTVPKCHLKCALCTDCDFLKLSLLLFSSLKQITTVRIQGDNILHATESILCKIRMEDTQICLVLVSKMHINWIQMTPIFVLKSYRLIFHAK